MDSSSTGRRSRSGRRRPPRAVWPAPSSATPPSSQSFFLTQRDDYSPIAWKASGAVGDYSTWDRGHVTFPGGESPGFAGMIQTVETNNAHTGSFRKNFQGRGTNDPFAFSGTWIISDGTGIYAGLHGRAPGSRSTSPTRTTPGTCW